jgi:catechol 2,3-dioxygenase-like lactoylglutathione lyase family enzyme
MSGFKVLATNHTSFTVSDLDRTLAFFRDGLGFEVTSRAPRDPALIQQITGVDGADLDIAYVRGPGHSLELIQYLAPADKGHVVSRPCDTGFAHVAYDVDNIDAAIATAADFDVTPVGQVATIDKGPNAGGRVCYLRDSDGITIEFIEKPGA